MIAVVEQEVGRHRTSVAAPCAGAEGASRSPFSSAQRGQVHQHADARRPRRRTGSAAAHGRPTPCPAAARRIPAAPRVELALAGSRSRKRRAAPDAQAARRGQQEVEQDLEAGAGQPRRRLPRTARRGIMKKPLIGSASGTGSKIRASVTPASRQQRGAAAKGRRVVAARHVAAADGKVRIAASQRRQHARQQGLVVLQVAVDHRDEGRGGGEHALDARGGQAAPADAADAAHARIAPGDAPWPPPRCRRGCRRRRRRPPRRRRRGRGPDNRSSPGRSRPHCGKGRRPSGPPTRCRSSRQPRLRWRRNSWAWRFSDRKESQALVFLGV